MTSQNFLFAVYSLLFDLPPCVKFFWQLSFVFIFSYPQTGGLHLPRLQADWAKYVWRDSKMDLFRKTSVTSVVAPSETTALNDLCSTTNLTHILQPDNMGLIVFCCLTGRPTFYSSLSAPTRNSAQSQLSPPIHLLVFLQRLLSSPIRPFSSGLFEWAWEKRIEVDSDGTMKQKPLSLSHQLTVTSSCLQTWVGKGDFFSLCTTVRLSCSGKILELQTTLFSYCHRMILKSDAFMCWRSFKLFAVDHVVNQISLLNSRWKI